MFHISRRDLGAFVTLTPKVPLNITKSECQTTPRVCFAPTVEQCVIALVGYAVDRDVTILGAFYELTLDDTCPTVYWTDEVLFEPDLVSDYHITHEEWSLRPITVERIGYIDCLEMVRTRQIEIVENPVPVEYAAHELIHHMTDQDRELLLKAIKI